MAKVRVLVVDDSITLRKKLREALDADPDMEVVAEAGDGRQAVELCARLRPDVVTLDMQLPIMNGLEATEHIMAHFPTPILIVSSSTNRADLFHTYEALAAGAVDVLEKPTGDEVDDAWELGLRAAVKLVARIRVITHPRGRLRPFVQGTTRPPASGLPGAPRRPRIVALGASTGGPAALIEVLRGVPTGLPFPVVVVLHIDEPFAAAFAEWLDQHTPHAVSFAREHERVGDRAGAVTMAPPGRHMIVKDGFFELTSSPERHSCRPSIDVLFESIAREYGEDAVACLLTGMGRDGASGLLAVRRAGAMTIAQDEKSSVVYGMPREAMLIGAAVRVLPLSEIGRAIADCVDGGARP